MSYGRRRGAAVAILITASVTLAGCSNEPSSSHKDARASLDPVQSQISLPLESYAMNWQETQLVNRANDISMKKCMAAKSLPYPRANQDVLSLKPLPDRRYGLWSESDASSNGYGLPEPSDNASIQRQEDALGEDWWNAVQSCANSVDQFPLMAINSAPDQSIVDRGMNESFDALLASALFGDERKKWLSCVEAAGLSANPDARVLVPQFPQAGEAQYKVAAADAGCKQSLNTVQTLANWEAGKQLDYVDQHEGELTAYRRSVDDVLARARSAVSNNEG